MVEVHFAHDRTHTRDSKLNYTADEVGNLIDGFDRIGDLPIDDRIYVDSYVIARNNGLRRQIYVLLAEIDGG
ncbi:hypothetical protein JVX88_08865 [Leptolyngbya sp. 7M]|nr:hypothetical protein [Leptolyngbya sp. 7M]QYO66897.1 hypothetical protein JVX88_08865 [Leptolyngbya sp. 7M]